MPPSTSCARISTTAPEAHPIGCTWFWAAPKIKRRRSCSCASISLIFKSNSAVRERICRCDTVRSVFFIRSFGEAPISTETAGKNFIDLTANIVSAYLSNNPTPAAEIPGLISQIHAALVRVSSGRTEAPLEPAKPAVSIKKSISPDYIVCLEDGKRFKSLKRHLRTQYNMTPEQYRDKWGLPPDYPMVAPNYAVARSQLAKEMGLGQQRRRRSK